MFSYLYGGHTNISPSSVTAYVTSTPVFSSVLTLITGNSIPTDSLALALSIIVYTGTLPFGNISSPDAVLAKPLATTLLACLSVISLPAAACSPLKVVAATLKASLTSPMFVTNLE